MTRQFVIAVEGASKRMKDAVTNLLDGSEYGYWHWMEDLWLIAGVEGDVGAQSLGEWIEEEIPGLSSLNYLVIEIAPGKEYWGRNVKKAWDWMEQDWG